LPLRQRAREVCYCWFVPGSNCVRLRGGHSGWRVWKQRRRQRRRAEQTPAHVYQPIYHLLGHLRHRPVHVQPSSPAALSTDQSLGTCLPLVALSGLRQGQIRRSTVREILSIPYYLQFGVIQHPASFTLCPCAQWRSAKHYYYYHYYRRRRRRRRCGCCNLDEL